ncbi:hypothetical protein [Spongiivirga citrea]|uniref:Polymer-forming cytoskeletal protein n=1 Tax=Spongiivirga citrea TaxID=1481457 RepID=A0A6M0CLS5_9FLAO|nr:hypothetical protein [Spongiivirga citrea]NER16789.1 hypothetical protein [Spongiivirga citrea]
MKRAFFIKLKAGSLQFVLFIGVVIALLLLAVILLTQTQHTFENKKEQLISTIQQTNALFKSTSLPQQDIDSTLKISDSNWGLFKKRSVRNSRFEKRALIGNSRSKTSTKALFVKDENRPLVLVGNTKIEGNVAISKSGLKAGNIAGVSFYGSSLVDGQVTSSKTELPSFDSNTKTYLKSLLSLMPSTLGAIDENYKPGGSLSNSFKNDTKVIYNDGAIDLYDGQLIGNIILKSATRITITANATLKDVIIVAPVIEIKSGVTGYFHAIASKAIEMGTNSNLQYPSSLILIDSDRSDDKNFRRTNHHQITVGENSIFKGNLMMLSENTNSKFEPQIIIGNNSAIHGEVYCEKSIELKGSVYGSVYAGSFIAKESGSTYLNHIYNGSIHGNSLPDNYAGLPFENKNTSVAKWLY